MNKKFFNLKTDFTDYISKKNKHNTLIQLILPVNSFYYYFVRTIMRSFIYHNYGHNNIDSFFVYTKQ